MKVNQDLTDIEQRILSELQQAIWDLNKAREHVQFAIGASAAGKLYIQDINDVIDGIQDHMDTIRE